MERGKYMGIDLKTLAQVISEKDADIFDFIQAILKRPGMYVGINRFDYVTHMLNGYCWGRASCMSKTEIDWLPDDKLQYWLLHTQSASLDAGALQARSLFNRCFGLDSLAFDSYKSFLETPLPEIQKTVYKELDEYKEKHNLVRYDWEDDVPSDHHQKLALSVFQIIDGMIFDTGFKHDKINIYVRRESSFCQVRFLFHSDRGWMDDQKLIVKPENHNLLIALHANAKEAMAEELHKHNCFVNDTDDYDNIFVFESTITNEKSFNSEYIHWKEKFIKNEDIP